MPDAQQLIAQVLGAHNPKWTRRNHPTRKGILVNLLVCTGCEWTADSDTHNDHLAAEVDKALGGLRKLTAIGHLTPSGVLLSGVEPTHYLQWISGWTAEAVS